MITILDRYILKSFLINFISAFFIISVIFIFQTIWLYGDDFIGKGVRFDIIAKFILLNQPNMIPMVVPFTVILSTVMTLGGLSEHYELIAMKASGISTFRALRMLFVFMGVLTALIFYTTGNLQPMAYQEFSVLRNYLKKKQPSLSISQGIFNNVQDYSIKVEKKRGENEEFLDNVLIHRKEGYKNTTCIKAKEGELNADNNSDILQLVLKDGTYYQDIKRQDDYTTFPFVKAEFEKYTINIDISEKGDENEQDGGKSAKAMYLPEIYRVTDSLQKAYREDAKDLSDNYIRRCGIHYVFRDVRAVGQRKDTIRNLEKLMGKMDKINLHRVYEGALNTGESLLTNINFEKDTSNYRRTVLNKFIIFFSNKFAFAFICFLLFLVSAPLGAHIKKGGFGMPIVVSFALFSLYYFSSLILNNFAEDSSVNPYVVPWVPSMILLPIGIYFMKKINKES